MVPILELKSQYSKIQDEIEGAVLRALRSTRYILGPEVEAFESEFAAYQGVEFAVGVGSGTEALHLALRALGIGPGDEVICPTFTFIATAGAVSLTGAKPVFADICLDTYTLDPSRIEPLITEATKAIIVVHLYGLAADMTPLLALARKRGLAVIEDCAQSTGALYKGNKVGTLGDVGCFSFFPSKNLGGIGDGGIVVTKRREIFELVKMLRGHGSKKKYYHDILGTNSRLDEIQAAALRVKLKYLDRWNEKRRAVAQQYYEGLSDLPLVLPCEPRDCFHVYHQYTVRTERRDELLERLREAGIGAVVYYPRCLHEQRVFSHLEHREGGFPAAETARKTVVSLPMYPELTRENIEKVVVALRGFFCPQVARAL